MYEAELKTLQPSPVVLVRQFRQIEFPGLQLVEYGPLHQLEGLEAKQVLDCANQQKFLRKQSEN